ncbi:hypothetical protein ABZX51_006124 [Aspergillus tubingensis]
MHSEHDAGFTVHCDSLEWLPLAPGVFIKIVKLVPETGEYTIMVRAEPGGLLPRHRHVESAEIYVLKGSGAHPQTGAFVQGDYVSEKDLRCFWLMMGRICIRWMWRCCRVW